MSENQQRRSTDPGAHYRGPNVFGIPLDPYRILEAYPNITREGARHVVKKILRMGKKGIDERQLIAEIRCCVDRWEQMLDEEETNAKIVELSRGFEAQNGIFQGKGLGKPVESAPIDPTPRHIHVHVNEKRTTKSAVRKARQAKRPAKKRKGRSRVGSLD